MTTWADAHRRAAVLAAQVHADLDMDLNAPVDVFAAIEKLGIVLAFSPLGRVSGLYIPGRASAGIILHSGHPRTRQRYTAGHELGHHVFGHAAEVDSDLETALRRDIEQWPDHEKEAEAFGAWFLMPRRLMREGLKQLDIDRPQGPRDVYALSLWLGTSYTATALQLWATRLVEPQQGQAWARVPPRNIKRVLAGDLVPDDLRNDVWWLDARRHRRAVEARPGDRVVLTLDEIPSSGFSWRFADIPKGIRVVADSYEDQWEPELSSIEDDRTEDLAGGIHARSFLIEIERSAQRGAHRLAAVKDQPWDPGDPSDSFELLVSVNPALHGLQVPECEFALTA